MNEQKDQAMNGRMDRQTIGQADSWQTLHVRSWPTHTTKDFEIDQNLS